jgi:hypothetical protein
MYIFCFPPSPFYKHILIVQKSALNILSHLILSLASVDIRSFFLLYVCINLIREVMYLVQSQVAIRDTCTELIPCLQILKINSPFPHKVQQMYAVSFKSIIYLILIVFPMDPRCDLTFLTHQLCVSLQGSSALL